MKHFSIISIIVAVLATCPQMVSAQTDSPDLLPIGIVPSAANDMPASTATYLENKLMQVVTQNGLGSGDFYSRFLITSTILPVTKDIQPGPPLIISENLDVTFYIVDNVDKKVFSSVTVSALAVDASEEKAFNKAVRSINANSRPVRNFIEDGKQKIIAFYQNQIDIIIATALSLAQQREYGKAFCELCAVPSACGSAYLKALDTGNAIYKDYVNYIGEINLAKAKAAWAGHQNSYGADNAGIYLSQILPDAKCYPEAQKLYQEIKSKVLDDWKFEMQVYRDGVDLEKARINAWKEVGVAYGKGQKSMTYNTSWLVR